MIRQEPRHEMDRLILAAGYGASGLSRLGVRVAKGYHWWVAVFTVSLIAMEALPLAPNPAIFWLIAYLVYFFLRQFAGQRLRKEFYRYPIQLARVFVGIGIVTLFLYSLGPAHQQTHLWLLYLLVLQVASKHCTTPVVMGASVGVFLALLSLHLLTNTPIEMLSLTYWQPLAIRSVWIGLWVFILHYLVRNIDARDDTIGGYRLVGALADQLDTHQSPSDYWVSVLEKCVEVFPAQSAFLWLCDDATRQLRLAARWPMREPVEDAESLGLDEDHIISSVARSTQGCLWDARRLTALFASDRIMRMPMPPSTLARQSLLLQPATLQEGNARRTVAVLGIGFAPESTPRIHLWPEYRQMLDAMIHHLKPLLWMDQAAQDLRLLDEIVRAISAQTDTTGLVRILLDGIVGRLGFEFATLSLVDEERDLIVCIDGRNVSQEWIRAATHRLASNDIQASIIDTGKTEILEGWDDRFDRKLWQAFGHADLIRVFAPIRNTERSAQRLKCLGTVEAGYHKKNRSRIDARQVAMLQAIISHAALVYQKIRTVERLERQTDAMESLHSVNRAISAARELPRVLNEIGGSAVRVLRANIVLLYRYSEEEHRIVQVMDFGDLWGEQPLDLTIREGGILDNLIRERKSYFALDASNDPILTESPRSIASPGKKHRSFTERQNIRSFAGAPLLVDGHIVGLLCANYRKRHIFEPDERQIIEMFAQQAALAIKNAEANAIISDRAARDERLRLARELHDSTSQFLPAIRVMTGNAEATIEADPAASIGWLRKINGAAEKAQRDIRVTVFEMKQMERQKAIGEAIADLAGQMREFFKMDVDTEIHLQESLPPAVESAAFALIREAVVNSARHAGAQKGRICLATRQGKLYLSVSDDGVGFDPGQVDTLTHRGIEGMRERIQLFGGKFLIRSRLGYGTQIMARIPLGREDNEW